MTSRRGVQSPTSRWWIHTIARQPDWWALARVIILHYFVFEVVFRSRLCCCVSDGSECRVAVCVPAPQSCMLLVGDCVWACSLNKTIHILSAETCCGEEPSSVFVPLAITLALLPGHCASCLLLCSVNHRLSHLEDDICDLTLDLDK